MRRSRRDPDNPDRYEPLPPLVKLPGWIWQKMGPIARIAAGIVLVALIAVGIYYSPRISNDKRDEAARQRQEDARNQAEERRRVKERQRPRTARAKQTDPRDASDAVRIHAREAIVADLQAAVTADARSRSDGPVIRAVCEGASGDSGDDPERKLGRATGRFGCTAVTSEIPKEDASGGGYLGLPYLARVRFDSGRLTFCQIAGVAGEGSYRSPQAIRVPAVCGG